MLDERVAAVRADELVGDGSEAGKLSTVYNCFTDEELVDFLNDMRATTPAKAVRTMRQHERLMKDLGDDIRGA